MPESKFDTSSEAPGASAPRIEDWVGSDCIRRLDAYEEAVIAARRGAFASENTLGIQAAQRARFLMTVATLNDGR